MKRRSRKDYEYNIKKGNILLKEAELLYSDENYAGSMKKFYSAALLFEEAKEIARLEGDVTLKLIAQDKELYCNEKIDEIQRFKNVNLDDLQR